MSGTLKAKSVGQDFHHFEAVGIFPDVRLMLINYAAALKGYTFHFCKPGICRETSLIQMKEPETSSKTSGSSSDRHESAEETSGVASGVQSEVEKLRDAAREQGAATMDQIKSTAQSALQNAQEASQTFVHEQKDHLIKRLSEYAKAAHTASEKLRGEGDNILASPAEKAAGSLDRVSEYLREKEPLELLDDLEAFARRKPEVFFGSLFVAGFAAARFFKASQRQTGSAQPIRSSAYQEPSVTISPAPGYPSTPGPDISLGPPPSKMETRPAQREVTYPEDL